MKHFKIILFLSVLLLTVVSGMTSYELKKSTPLTIANIEALSHSEYRGYESYVINSYTYWDEEAGAYFVINYCNCVGYGNLDCSDLSC